MKNITVKELCIFALLGAMMFASKTLMEFLPNVHLLGVFTVAITVVYRKKALYPIYTYVLLNGVYAGFNPWWIPYLYIWTVLWGATMLLPKNMNPKVAPIVYMIVCSLHGFLFGTLYAPAQAIMFGLNFQGTITWIIQGLPYDCVHGISNFICGILIVPLIKLLEQLNKAKL